VSVVIVGVIRRKPVLTHASIVCEGMLASVNSVNSVNTSDPRQFGPKKLWYQTSALVLKCSETLTPTVPMCLDLDASAPTCDKY